MENSLLYAAPTISSSSLLVVPELVGAPIFQRGLPQFTHLLVREKCSLPAVGYHRKKKETIMTTIDVLNPEYETEGPDEVRMADRSTLVDPVVITVIENSKPHAKELLTYVAEGLQERLPVAEIVVHSKPSASKPIDADEAEMFAARSHLVISGLGD